MIWSFIKNLFPPRRDVIEMFGRTDTGLVRPHNEDSFCLLPNQNIFMVADGMGGHNAGEVASKVAIETMVGYVNDGTLLGARNNTAEIQHFLIKSLRDANTTVIAMANAQEEHKGMGCTFVLGFVGSGNLYTCHVGDVRAYIVRPDVIELITNDHSYAAEFKRKANEDPDFDATISAPAKNIISRAIGFPFPEDPEFHNVPVVRGERILLCSDGLWSMVPDDVIRATINSSETPELACDALIERANEAGGKDNITAVVVFM